MKAVDGVTSAKSEVLATIEALGQNSILWGTQDGRANQGQSSDSKPQTTQDRWEAPAYFNEFDLPEFPGDVLPAWLDRFVKGVATSTQTPIDLPAMLGLTVCAAAVAGNVRIQARRGWQEPLNLYTVTALSPGNRKSAVFAECIKPLSEIEGNLIEETRSEITRAASEHRILEQRRQDAEREAGKAKSQTDLEQLKRKAMEIAEEMDAIVIPAIPKLVADDATPESIATLLCEQRGRLAVLSPEGDLFDIAAGRYSNGSPNFAVLLKGHSGDDLRVDRRNRSEFVPKPALTIGLAVQPDVIRGLVSKPGFRGRGLIGRFLYTLPVSRLGTRKVRAEALDEAARQEYARCIKLLAATNAPVSPNGQAPARILYLTAEADDRLAIFEEEVERQLGEGGELSMMTDWAGKLAGAVLRIAGVIHLAELVCMSSCDDQVSAFTVARAIDIGRYLIPHAIAAYAEMGADEQIERAKSVLRWIERAGLTSFTKRDAHQANKARFKKVDDIEPALDLLQAHYFIRPQVGDEDKRPGRKPSQVYEVNPLLSCHSHKSQNSQNVTPGANFEHCENSENTPLMGGLPRTPTSNATGEDQTEVFEV